MHVRNSQFSQSTLPNDLLFDLQLSILDDEIYRKKLTAKREEILKKERAIYTFSPHFSVKRETHALWCKRAHDRFAGNVSNENDISAGNVEKRIQRRLEQDELWQTEAGGGSIGDASSITLESDAYVSQSS